MNRTTILTVAFSLFALGFAGYGLTVDPAVQAHHTAEGVIDKSDHGRLDKSQVGRLGADAF